MVAALAPCAWRELPERMLARRVIGALDRYVVLHFLSDVPGVDVGPVQAIDLAEADDARVDVLVGELDGRQWRSRSLVELAADLVASLEAWYAARGSLDPDLLDEP